MSENSSKDITNLSLSNSHINQGNYRENKYKVKGLKSSIQNNNISIIYPLLNSMV